MSNENIEPKDYFQELKNSINNQTDENLKINLEIIKDKIIKADAIGQKQLVDKLAFTFNVIEREQKLLINGINKFVYKEDITKFIEKVDRKVKIIELERYPRLIPDEVSIKIQKAKELNVFDGFIIVFTDLTGQTYTTPEEKEYVNKNKDPIVFGYFSIDNIRTLTYERFYMIADWEDEYCDLTFSKLVDKMTENKIGKSYTIDVDESYINELVSKTVIRLQKPNENHVNEIKKESNIIYKLIGFIKNIF